MTCTDLGAGCKVRALIATSPSVTSITTTDPDTLTVTGSGLLNANLIGWSPKACLGGAKCDIIVTRSDTEIVFQCEGGVPRSVSPSEFELEFTNDDGLDCIKRAYEATPVELPANPPTVTSSSLNKRVSFKGGAKYEIQGNGLHSTLAKEKENCGNDPNIPNNNNNRVEVCG